MNTLQGIQLNTRLVFQGRISASSTRCLGSKQGDSKFFHESKAWKLSLSLGAREALRIFGVYNNTERGFRSYVSKSSHPAVPCWAMLSTFQELDSKDESQFLEASKRGNLVPLFRRIFSDQLTPVLAYRCLVKEDNKETPSFLYESVQHGKHSSHPGRFSTLGAQPAVEIIAKERNLIILNHEDGSREERIVENPIDEPYNIMSKWNPVIVDGLPENFHGGWVGYLSYGITTQYGEKGHLSFDGAPEDDRDIPDIEMGLYKDVVVFDHVSKIIYVVHWVEIDRFESTKAAYEHGKLELELLVSKLQDCERPKLPSGKENLNIGHYLSPTSASSVSRVDFKSKVKLSKEQTLDGEIVQIELSQRHTFADPFEVYRALRVVNPSPYMIYLQTHGSIKVGASPEILTRSTKEVEGELKEHITSFVATLPVAIVGKSPKLVDKLEPTRRVPCSAGIGHVSFSGDLDIAWALKTIVFPIANRYNPRLSYKSTQHPREWIAVLQTGVVGVVSGSDFESDHLEYTDKAAGLSLAIDFAEAIFVGDL